MEEGKMQVDANKVIEKLSLQVAQQAQQIAILQVQLEVCLEDINDLQEKTWKLNENEEGD